MKLDHYLKIWNLSEPERLAKTATSDVFVVKSGDTKAVLKLITPYGFEERSGAVALDYFGGLGAVHLLRHDDDAHLLEYADGNDLVGFVKNGEDNQATDIIGEVLNRLHSVSGKTFPEGLTPLAVWFRELFKRAEMEPDSIYARGAAVARKLLDDPREVRVLHGDIHHENIRYRDGRGWLAFDPKGLVGERAYDAANTLCNPYNMWEIVHNEARVLRTSERLARKMDIDPARLLAFVFAYSCLSASWFLSDNADPSQPSRVAEIVERHLHHG